MRNEFYQQSLKETNRYGFGIAPAPCDPSKPLEIPIGATVGQLVKCPICGGWHRITGVNENAGLS